jgi:hypothetical protein
MLRSLVVLASLFASTACAQLQAPPPAIPGAVVVTREESGLFGSVRTIFVCRVAESGASACQAADAP